MRWQALVQRLQFEYGFEESLRLFASAAAGAFMQDLLRPDTFEHFLVLGPKGAVLFGTRYDAVPAGPLFRPWPPAPTRRK